MISFFRTRANRKYDPIPIYYDEEKERKKELSGSEKLRYELEKRWKGERKKTSGFGQNIRILIIVGLIFLMLYFMNLNLEELISSLKKQLERRY